MTAQTSARLGEARLLRAAVSGDAEAFRRLVEPHRRALHLHCYRMLASLHDADDALQETLLRAWQSLGRFEPRAPLPAWLHAIATNVCLTALGRRRQRPEPVAPEAAERAWSDQLLHLQPYPDRLLDELGSTAPSPETRYLERETVELAFVTALNLLPPKQRAVLILRDVLGWSAKETASALDDSIAAVNSALQRARASLDRRRGATVPAHASAGTRRDRAVLRRFMDAWDAVDIDALATLLAEDALMTMPPTPMHMVGREAVAMFFATVPAGGDLRQIRLTPTAANRQPALAAYLRDTADGAYRAYGVMVLTLDGDVVTSIVGFADASLYGDFGLPLELVD